MTQHQMLDDPDKKLANIWNCSDGNTHLSMQRSFANLREMTKTKLTKPHTKPTFMSTCT